MERIPASDRTREKLKALMEGRGEVADGRSELVRLAARLIIEEALEGEARDAVGRDYYARGATPGSGYRNGYRPGRVNSAEGAIEYSAPQIADRSAPFRSRIREVVRGRTEELEALAVEMYARGLSTRDIEAVFADTDGRSLLSRSAVSEITERLWAEYEAFASRDLAEFEVTYLFVDGIAAKRCWRRGASWETAKRRSCIWRREPRRTRRAAESSSRRCAAVACLTRCWWPATGRPA
jgi:transposase-like protein